MSTTRYTRDHEYVRLDGDLAVVGISHFAQDKLGDVVFVELPEIGRTVAKGKEAAVVESVKAASDIYAPLSGEVVEVNTELEGAPGTVNEEPEGKGWFFKLKVSDPAELDDLMTEEAYKAFLATVE